MSALAVPVKGASTMPAARADSAIGATTTRVSRGRTTDSDSFFHSPPTGLADGLGREDAPYDSQTSRADSPLGKWFPGSDEDSAVRMRRTPVWQQVTIRLRATLAHMNLGPNPPLGGDTQTATIDRRCPQGGHFLDVSTSSCA